MNVSIICRCDHERRLLIDVWSKVWYCSQKNERSTWCQICLFLYWMGCLLYSFSRIAWRYSRTKTMTYFCSLFFFHWNELKSKYYVWYPIRSLNWNGWITQLKLQIMALKKHECSSNNFFSIFIKYWGKAMGWFQNWFRYSNNLKMSCTSATELTSYLQT